jgi:hypothetical protein
VPADVQVGTDSPMTEADMPEIKQNTQQMLEQNTQQMLEHYAQHNIPNTQYNNTHKITTTIHTTKPTTITHKTT